MSGGRSTTVVIATRDRWPELARTLRELRRAQPEAPVVVVDNASGDGTPTAVAQHHPHVRLVRLPHNLGAVARNVGVLCARTPYVALCDDDSWWHSGSLERAAEIFAAHPDVGLIAGRTLVGDREREDPVVAAMAASPLGWPEHLPGPAVLGFTACAAVVRRDAFLRAGGFSRLLFFVAEEKLLSYELAALGWELVHVHDVVAHHHPSSSRARGRQWVEQRNNALIAWLRRPAPLAWRRSTDLAAWAMSDPAGLRELFILVRKLPAALRRRRPLPERVERQAATLEPV